MKIKSIQAIPVKLQLKEPFHIANVTNFDMFYVIVRLETDDGIIGFGEATPSWEVTGETWQSVKSCIELFCNKLLLGFSIIGQKIDTLEEVKELIEKINPTENIQLIAANSSAKAALEQAIFDAFGKKTKRAIYELFKGRNKPVPFTKNISIFSVKETLHRVEEGIKNGFDIIRLKIGIENFDGKSEYKRDREVINKSFELISHAKKKILLVADANQGFASVDKAAKFCSQVEGKLDWLEQPILAGNFLQLKKLKSKTEIPLMADESMNSYSTAEMLLELGCIDYLNIKLMKTGGILSALKVIELAKKYKVKCQIGSMIESELGTAMGCQLYMCDDSIISTDLNSFDLLSQQYAKGLAIRDNRLYLSNDVGTGINIDMSQVKKFQIR